MPKHVARQFTPARLILGLAAAVLVALVGWIVVRVGGSETEAGNDPQLIQPSAAELQAVENHIPLDQPLATATVPAGVSPSPSVSLSVSPSASASPSASVSASPSVSRPASASPAASTAPVTSTPSRRPPASPTPERTTAEPPASPRPTADTFTATYSTSADWGSGFIGSVRIANNSSSSRDFSVTVRFSSASDIRVYGSWNASVSGDDDQVTVRGTLGAGRSITAGFQAGKDHDDSVRSATCSVSGGSCRVS
ncbi:hypothetical protein AMIS_8900 [Actinoplanes missouriensis 431]|uniref:CBM2 domain-containing protein n=1 Tax=Actinoplanes missouriensis (strain ATCC 14538 / DSM 43046 / CBS 188.64 / JCM 3121 / NBRC 102363 / NCIMB 12654 / NRRL B-3342 / UNCC 431) TaxID=512565 RepID=I0GZC3_ACTM4|nr:hypothetical protein AMIS_8900 [Actinoplanes missouriensis 431]